MIERELHEYAEEAYLQYAVATVRDRALAQVEDGQKPVHRRILYAMYKLGLTSTSKPVKSARVIGDVIGKYHPHGDTSAYDAMVRMAQPFSMRYPLVEGQGNFGSLDGDSPAAMRYTEVRMAPISDLLLAEVNQGAVDYGHNYDNSHTEPTRLPGRLPLLLLNGSMGIAVGLAANLPSHNLREVGEGALLAVTHPQATDAEIMASIPGPDFPGGGVLISSPEEIAAAYATGSGPFRVRAKVQREELARGQWRWVATELPPDVSAARILEQLNAVAAPLIKTGKKSLDQDQLNLRQMALSLIERATDESSARTGLRLVVHPKTSKVSQADLEQFLFAHTDLESAFHANMTWLRPDGTPVTAGVPEILREWAGFRVHTVRRRTAAALDKVLGRIHILEGRSLVFLRLEDVIRTIKNADEPRPALEAEFGLTAVQAEDILEMRLRQLSRLVGFELEAELARSRKEADRLKGLLDNEKALRTLTGKEIRADIDRFGDDRRTLLDPQEKTTRKSIGLSLKDEPVTVMLTNTMWVKVKPGHEPATESFKKGHELQWQLPTSTTATLTLLDSSGRSYSIAVADLPGGRSEGEPLSKHVDFAGKLTFALTGQPEARLLLAGSGGYGFVTTLSALASRLRGGKQVLTLEPDESPIAVPVAGSSVAVASSAGRLVIFPLESVKELAKGKGVKLIGLKGSETVAWVRAFDDVLTLPSGAKLPESELPKYRVSRGAKGGLLPKQKSTK
jgi:topoisomerase-4 subunit A